MTKLVNESGVQTYTTTLWFFRGSRNMNSGPHGKYFINWAILLTSVYRVIKSHCMWHFHCSRECPCVSRFGDCLCAHSAAGCLCSHTNHNALITVVYNVFLTHWLFGNVFISAVCKFPKSFLLLMFNFIPLWQENTCYITFVLNLLRFAL